MGLGMLLSFIGWFLIFQKNYTGFAALYTIGNCVALCATGFFTGPKKQCKVVTSRSSRNGCRLR